PFPGCFHRLQIGTRFYPPELQSASKICPLYSTWNQTPTGAFSVGCTLRFRRDCFSHCRRNSPDSHSPTCCEFIASLDAGSCQTPSPISERFAPAMANRRNRSLFNRNLSLLGRSAARHTR